MGGLHFQQAHNSGATWQVDALLDCIAHLAADPKDLFCLVLLSIWKRHHGNGKSSALIVDTPSIC